jgi:hypothetical protein
VGFGKSLSRSWQSQIKRIVRYRNGARNSKLVVKTLAWEQKAPTITKRLWRDNMYWKFKIMKVS